MSWAKLDDDLWRHPKMDYLHGSAFELYICSITFCAERLTDGFLSHADVAKILSFRGIPRTVVDELTADVPPDDTPFWEIVKGGYTVHNYLKRNPSKAKVAEERAEAARRQEEFRKRQEEKKATLTRKENSNAVVNGVANAVTNAVTNGVTNGVVNSVPYPYPYPFPVPVPGESKDSLGDDPPPEAAPDGARGDFESGDRESRAFWTALVEEIGAEPMTSGERAKWNGGISDLRRGGVTVSHIPIIVAAYRKRYPHATCNPRALANNLSALQSRSRAVANDEPEPFDVMMARNRREAELIESAGQTVRHP
jgi:hypothetical protein